MQKDEKGLITFIPLAVITLFGLTGIGVVVAAGQSREGDTLFPVKVAVESLTHPFSDQEKFSIDTSGEQGSLNKIEDNSSIGGGGEFELRGRENEMENHARWGVQETVNRSGDDSKSSFGKTDNHPEVEDNHVIRQKNKE